MALPLLIVGSYQLVSNNARSCTTCPTPEQAAYFTRQADAAREFREADRRLAALLDQVQQSPGSLYAERWRLRDILDRMNFAAGDMIDPETPSGAEEHQLVMARYSEGQVEANEIALAGCTLPRRRTDIPGEREAPVKPTGYWGKSLR